MLLKKFANVSINAKKIVNKLVNTWRKNTPIKKIATDRNDLPDMKT